MKIICDSCRTKYSIADEKVKGKVFKIRCKKCSNIIVVRGNQPQPEAAGGDEASAAPAAGAEDAEAPTWHLVVDQKQVGPMTGTEVRDKFARGEVDAETYIWREGFTDWQRIGQVEDFSDVAESTVVAGAPGGPALGHVPEAAAGASEAGAPAAGAGEPWGAGAQGHSDEWGASAASGGGGAADSGGPAVAPEASGSSPWPDEPADADKTRADGGGLFSAGAAGDEPTRDLFGAGAEAAQDSAFSGGGPAASSGGGGGLFGASATSAADQGGADIFSGVGGSGGAAMGASGSDLAAAVQPATGSNGGQQMFSQGGEQPGGGGGAAMTGQRNENSVLFSLTNLQALAMGNSSPAAAPAASPATPGPTGSGSGLIDIRSMAGASGPAGGASGGDAGLPDLGGFTAPVAAAPVLMASGAEERPKWLLPVILGGGGLLVAATVTLVLVLVLRSPAPAPVAAVAPGAAGQTGTPAAKKASDIKKPASKGSAKSAAAAEDDDGSETAASDSPKPKAEAKPTRRSRSSSARRSRKPSRRTESRAASRRESAPAPSARRKSGKRDALDDLIDGAVGGGRKASRSRAGSSRSAAANSNLPETLGRSEIQRGMRGIKGKVQGCYDRYKVPGMANVQVRISGNGRVSTARVLGMFSGTPTGACVQTAARSARFPKFKGSPISIRYPFILR